LQYNINNAPPYEINPFADNRQLNIYTRNYTYRKDKNHKKTKSLFELSQITKYHIKYLSKQKKKNAPSFYTNLFREMYISMYVQ
jgi:hypothetical protein